MYSNLRKCALIPLLLAAGCAPLVNRVQPPREPEVALTPQALKSFLAGIPSGAAPGSRAGTVNGERVIADFSVAESGCLNILVTYQDIDHSEVWERCGTGDPRRPTLDLKALPRSDEFKAVRHAVSQTARLTGSGIAYFAEYEITAAATAAEDGCAVIENAVRRDGRDIDTRSEKFCAGR